VSRRRSRECETQWSHGLGAKQTPPVTTWEHEDILGSVTRRPLEDTEDLTYAVVNCKVSELTYEF
jgi:hypothetical protein